MAALTWDALLIVQKAIENAGALRATSEDRASFRDQMAKIKEFAGITGKMNFTAGNDPIKCAVIVKISDQGEFEFFKSVCPE